MASTCNLLSTLLCFIILQYATISNAATTIAACVSNYCNVKLSPDLTMRYRAILPADFRFYNDHGAATGSVVGGICDECRLSVQLFYEGNTWLGIGPSPKGQMIGSRAVIGRPGISDPRAYYLSEKDARRIEPVTESGLTESGIEYDTDGDGRTVMEFTASFRMWGIQSHIGPGLNNFYTFIWAHGNEGEANLGYHGPMGKSSFTITNLMGFTSRGSASSVGVDSNAMKEEDPASMTSLDDGASVTVGENLWMAMAFFAFGILFALTIVLGTRYMCSCQQRRGTRGGLGSDGVELAGKEQHGGEETDVVDNTREIA